MKENLENPKFKIVLDFIKEQRKSKNLTQLQIAKMLNISNVKYNMIEQNKQIFPAHILLSISEILNIDLNEIASIYNKTSKTCQRTIPETVQPDYIENLQKLCSQQQSIIDTQQKLISSLELKLKL